MFYGARFRLKVLGWRNSLLLPVSQKKHKIRLKCRISGIGADWLGKNRQISKGGSDLLKKALLVPVLSLAAQILPVQGAVAADDNLALLPEKPPASSQKVFLQGGVQQMQRIPAPCPAIYGFGAYQQGWYLLGMRQFQAAAEYFQVAGDQMEASSGRTRFLAEARFAEAQTRRLIGQYDRSKDLYRRAIAVFEEVDPTSFYLNAARTALKEMSPKEDPGKPAPLKGQVKKSAPPKPLVPLKIPGIEKVDSDFPLSGKITQLDNGVSINSLHDGDFFNRSRGTLTQTAAVDISDEYVKNVIHKAWLKMNCLETGAVGATHYSAPIFYKAIKSGGKPVAVGAGSDLLSPTAELKLNGKIYKVAMDLPHISPNTRNVMLITDDKNVLAVDPRTSETWKLCANFAKKVPEFNWWKLGRQKGRKFS